MEALRISLKRKEVPVVLEDADGNENDYVLREMLGKDRDKYLTGMSGKMRYDAKGNPKGLKSFDGLQASLLCITLFDSEGNPVSKKDIQEFPSSAVNDLFKKSQEINALDEEENEEVKND